MRERKINNLTKMFNWKEIKHNMLRDGNATIILKYNSNMIWQ
jgi:hypothetical protein